MVKDFLRWTPWFIIGGVVVVAALMIDMDQDRANLRPTKTVVRPALVLTPEPSKTIAGQPSLSPTLKPQALCITPRGPEPVGTRPAYLERPMRGFLTAEYVCLEADGSMVTRTVTFMAFYDALEENDVVKLTSLCPKDLSGGRFKLLLGSCRVGGGAMRMLKTPTSGK